MQTTRLLYSFTNALKPFLRTGTNLTASELLFRSAEECNLRADFVYDNLTDMVHVEEKLFYLKKGKQPMYIGLEENMPERNIIRKHSTRKAMLL